METKVYVLKHPITDKIRYVGITTRNLKQRLNEHLNDVKQRPDLNYHKISWIKSLQKDNLIPTIEEIAKFDTIEEAKQFEIDFIAKYRILYDLTNCTVGGDHLGFNSHTRESILKRRATRGIKQFNIYGELIAEYEITEDAAKALELSSASKITMCCRKKRPHAHGYIWRYKDEDLGDISLIDHNSLCFCDLVQCDINGNEIKRWDSYQEAGKEVGDRSKGGNIAACVKGQQRSCKGFIWKVEYKLKRGSL